MIACPSILYDRPMLVAQDDIFKEIDILIGLDHPNVIFLKEYFEENNKVCCCAGDSLHTPVA